MLAREIVLASKINFVRERTEKPYNLKKEEKEEWRELKGEERGEREVHWWLTRSSGPHKRNEPQSGGGRRGLRRGTC